MGERVTISDVASDAGEQLDALALEEALRELAASHERPARVAELRLYAGMTVPEVAEILEISSRTVDYDWRFARSVLRKALGGGEP